MDISRLTPQKRKRSSYDASFKLKVIRYAELSGVAQWVIRAWDLIDEEMIRNSFLKTGIANKLDGSEDDCLFNDLIASPNASSDTQNTADTMTGSDDEGGLTDDDMQNFYDTDRKVTDEEIRKLFDSDSESEDFDGF